jgi:hypothetical protein
MAYVIYNKETTEILQARARSVGCYKETYKSESAAKAALTRLARDNKLGCETIERYNGEYESGLPNIVREQIPYTKEDFAIAELGEFRANIEKKVLVKNIMSGEMIEESVNTPYTQSVASETYWCS